MSSDDILDAIAIVKGQRRRGTRLPNLMSSRRGQRLDFFGQSSRSEELADNLRRSGIQGEKLRAIELSAAYLGVRGESAVRSTLVQEYQKRLRPIAHQEVDRVIMPLDETLSKIDRENRALLAARSSLERPPEKQEIRASKSVMRVAACAIMEMERRNGRSLTITEAAKAIPKVLLSAPGLAVLFDEQVKFKLTSGKILLQAKMRYKYAKSSIKDAPQGLTYDLDSSDPAKPQKATQLEDLAVAANNHLEELSSAYPPLRRVHEYAALAAFLRWAACPRSSGDSCSRRDGLSIDLSALGDFDLRSKNMTPTPDLDLK